MHTGNTHLYPSYSCSVSVYPCAYREHRDHRIIPGTVHGLSLCIQGTLALTFPFIGWVRFIPVHTGNTVSEVINLVLESGLSLCIQGTQGIITKAELRKRFIPVHTGNTVMPPVFKFFNSVYPCAYREHEVNNRGRKNANGLSLCIQGTPRTTFPFVSPSRFIPVHTGNTSATKWNITDESVYPCAYREHCCPIIKINCSNGLSLCIQGTPVRIWWQFWFPRFIPVHTGNTR